MTRKGAISRAFGAAAGYDDKAHVQSEVAGLLATHIAGLPLPADPQILEIGCGTGFLTHGLIGEGVGGSWIVTDLSDQMVQRCRAGMSGAPHVAYAVMDGESPCFSGAGFDLICSNLSFQWFYDLPGSVMRLFALLRPGGHLVFTTMADGSFAEWRLAHEACGLKAAIPDYPSTDDLRALAPGKADADIFDFSLQPAFGSGKGFIEHLRGIGAQIPKGGTQPLAPGEMRRVIRVFEAAGARSSYHIACCTFRKLA